MEWMPCHCCGEQPWTRADDWHCHYAFCQAIGWTGCKAHGVSLDSLFGEKYSEIEARLIKAWNDLQSQRARLDLLEAMLQSQDAAAEKSTKGRL
jgi:hypothetical protein